MEGKDEEQRALKWTHIILLGVCAAAVTEPVLRAQSDASGASNAVPPSATERWSLSWQATSIGSEHGSFFAAYSGPRSLSNRPEHDVSLTTTLFFAFRVTHNTLFVFDPEIAGGRGFSLVDGLANANNGELPRVASATPKPYIARLFLTHDFAFGDEKEPVETDDNQPAGERPLKRYTITIGRFTLTDYFDNNDYTHDPRTQFMGWAVMYNGAWDYAADTRGYTWGWVHEYHTKRWAVRYASALEPKQANGSHFDRAVLRDRGDNYEGEIHFWPRSHEGILRLLAYTDFTDSGSYGRALQLAAATHTAPNVFDTDRPGTLKYGFGVNFQQEITRNVGVFSRLGWNDGKTQDFAFTAIDRLATGGISIKGTRWGRPEDVIASEFTASGLSAVHALYLARGGLDFIIGDGALNYAPEEIWESYYSALMWKHPGENLWASVDGQYIVNPAYNQDRGPLWAWSLRLHVEVGKPK